MIRKIAIATVLATSLGLAGCAATTTAAATATVSSAQTKLQAAINLWGIAKGIAQVAGIADPALAPILGAGIAAVDPLVTQAQVALSAATIDATAIETLAATITARANTLTVQAAPVITVVPTT